MLHGALLSALFVSAEIVSVALPPDVSVAPGSATEVALRLSVADGFHVQANPAAKAYLVPLELTWEECTGVEAEVDHYPESETFTIPGTDEELWTYEGAIDLAVSLRVDEEAPPGARVLRGWLRYQACDDRSCRRPETLPLELPVRITTR